MHMATRVPSGRSPYHAVMLINRSIEDDDDDDSFMLLLAATANRAASCMHACATTDLLQTKVSIFDRYLAWFQMMVEEPPAMPNGFSSHTLVSDNTSHKSAV